MITFSTAVLLSLISSAAAISYTSTFTQYGAGDTRSSGNCNTATAACGFYSFPGYNAAASQNLFGVGDGQGAGPGCGLCWQLTPEFLDDGVTQIAGANAIVVKVNNLCPANGNVLCAQNDLSGQSRNQYMGELSAYIGPEKDATVNFDLCIDDGAAAQLFGSSGTALAIGTATQVPCSGWSGSLDLTSGTNSAITGPPPSSGGGGDPSPPPIDPAAPLKAAKAPVAPPTTLTTVYVAPSAPTDPAAGAGTQTMYGQCGGQGYSGLTNCVASATCTTQNPYYAQCTPT
ncbi:hypothetical protein MMC26_005867 [Xylographa opegraphella]|nr:hypothetical protein [Xylographa opegraphella]